MIGLLALISLIGWCLFTVKIRDDLRREQRWRKELIHQGPKGREEGDRMIAMILAMQLAVGGTNQKAALTCDKYQHVQHHPKYCHGAPCNETTGTCIAIAICEDAKPGYLRRGCQDDDKSESGAGSYYSGSRS